MKNEGGGSSGVTSAVKPTNFALLSEGCVSYILSQTSPRDVGRASSISRGFKCFADSDAVWERFLPADYLDIIARSVSPVVYSSKKELYFRLCDSPILLDDGNLSFYLNKKNGKKCFMLGAHALSIAWQDTLVFWRWRSLTESRFSKVAELLAVCWLEIKGNFRTKMLTSATSYAAYLVYNIGEISHGLDFTGKTLVRHVGGDDDDDDVAKTVYLKPPKTGGGLQDGCRDGEVMMMGGGPQRRVDGWMEIELGRFYNGENAIDDEVEMCFMETRQLHWKSGLIVEGIDIRPID
ncbi:putative F-box protein PP2-B12 [Lactuca sativa]|uniref:F-box domain-containing protein n=1 Tax=Lactuca sativa TaxID=4236 RepID=A0A9R1XRK3_LACSA|nr:putative F-box protein PP2-B12 [Lactuca sativa]KAJ0224815.1 hypothetical protein LSAT_V11C100029060 [Lactuca sativa]